MRFGRRRALSLPTGADVREKQIGHGAMLYDPSLVARIDERWFDARWWRQQGRVRGSWEGRGPALLIEADGRGLVLRHYRRGGWAGRLSTDRYFWQGPAVTRSFQEWHLLYLMRRAMLPVPVPVAACYHRHGRLYTADLLTGHLEDTRSLAATLRQRALPLTGWVAIGRCLRRFHDEGVYHADLNAHNVLLRGEQEVWLIDFDRARLRRPGLWCDANLVRLRRSIEKVTEALPAERFAEADWSSMLGAYFAAARPEAAAAPS